MFAVIYFFMIAPQMRKAKKERKFLTDLKTGDRVVMKSGMHGRVNHINHGIMGAGLGKDVALITDGRFSENFTTNFEAR